MRFYRKCLRFCLHITLLFISALITRKLYFKWIIVKEQKPTLRYSSQEELQRGIELQLQDLVVREQSSGCKMPVLDPFSAETKQFDENMEKITCKNDVEWIDCNYTECSVKKSILNQMKVSCTYMDIVYIDDDNYYLGTPVRIKHDGKYFLNVSDYVKIYCVGVRNKTRQRSWWVGRKAGYRPISTVPSKENSINVLALILNSVSRSTLIRRMPISYNILKNELGAVVLNGYNIVGENSAGALFPILTGHNEFEVLDSKKRPSNTKRVDLNPFLFTLLKKHGYRTAYFEDMPWYHTFNLRFNGFERMPSDHYMRILFQAIGWLNVKDWTDEERYCFGSESLFKFMVKYAAKLFKIKGKKFCVTVSGTFTHDNINAITMIDEDLADFLRKFKRNKHLDDTLLFVMADHGSQLFDIRNTYQSKIEEFLPFVSVVLPLKLKQSRPRAAFNLRHNSNVLTTPFDIHTTILDALGLKSSRNMYKVPGARHERGMSFLEPLPVARSCGEAGIMPHFCSCARWQRVSANDIIYMKVGRELTHFINTITKQHRQMCAERVLLSISEVYRLEPMMMMNLLETETTANVSDSHISNYRPNLHSRPKPNLEYYQAKIKTSPGEAIFEGSIQYNVIEDFFMISNRDISRINKYEEESHCVSNSHPYLCKYCYCIDVL